MIKQIYKNIANSFFLCIKCGAEISERSLKERICGSCEKPLTHYIKYKWECPTCNNKKSQLDLIDESNVVYLHGDEISLENDNQCVKCGTYLEKNIIEYSINNLLKLKKINGKTIIYVADKPHVQCMKIILSINLFEDIDGRKANFLFDEAKNIDDIIDLYIQKNPDANLHEYDKDIIDLDSEFWGHCSNLEVFAESGYNLDVLSRSLSFRLLRKLYWYGDPIAKNKYPSELLNIVESGSEQNLTYLINENYFDINENDMDKLIEHTKNEKREKLLKQKERIIKLKNPSLKGYIMAFLSIMMMIGTWALIGLFIFNLII